MKRCGIYVRVSTQEQKKHGLSVDNQIVAIREYCKQNGYEEIALYNDAGISARKSYKKRPALLQMLEDCQHGKIDLLLFTKLDRFFRSVPDYYACVEQMNNVPWRAIWEDYETETSAGVFKVNIMLSIAQAEADRTSERIKNTFEYKRAKGDYLGQVPYGYIRKDGKLYKDEATKAIVRKAFDTYLQTHSTTAVIRMMVDEGYNPSKHQVQRIIFGDVYRGYKGECKFEPYITEEEYARIQEIRHSNYRTPKHSKGTYLFGGLIKCGCCGYKLRAQYNIFNGIRYNSYNCRSLDNKVKHGKGMSISERKIEGYLLENIATLVDDYNISISATNTKKINNDKKIQSLENKLKRIGIRFEDGDISTEEYREKRKEVLSELSSLKSNTFDEVLELPTNWKEMYEQLDNAHKRNFWYSIIKSITFNEDRTFDVDFL